MVKMIKKTLFSYCTFIFAPWKMAVARYGGMKDEIYWGNVIITPSRT